MKVVALVSGGKDSCYVMMKCIQYGHETYVKFITQEKCPFGVPSRSTIELPLVQAGLGKAYVEVLVANDHSKRVLHVQSISSWAPSCIGPYSQATLHKGVLHMAGQLGLDPPTMNLRNEGAIAELNQALTNSEAIAEAFRCSISSSAILFVVFCSERTKQSERNQLHEKFVSFLDLAKSSRRVANVIDPIFLYILVPDLPKSALVEVKPVLYVEEDSEDDDETRKDQLGEGDFSCWGYKPEKWHQDCLQTRVIDGKICVNVLSISAEVMKKLDEPSGDEEQPLKRVSRFCVYLLDKTLSENLFSWQDTTSLRIHFSTSLGVSVERLSVIFETAFEVLNEMSLGVISNGLKEPIFSLVPVLGAGNSSASLDNIITCELFSLSTIELPLVQAGLGKAYVEVLVANDHSKRVLHVQSISSWAPSCIGPYSQATLHKGVLHMAGQLGLDPPTMSLRNEGAVAELNQALTNSEAIAEAFRCSITSSAILFVVFCSERTQQSERNQLHEKFVSFLDLAKSSQRVSNVIDPIFLYILVPDLPKRALVEVKPVLYVEEDTETDDETRKEELGEGDYSCFGYKPEKWHQDCVQTRVVDGKICVTILSISAEVMRKLHEPSGDEKQQLERVSRFCVYLLDKTLSENSFSWQDTTSLRIHFSTSLGVSVERLSDIFETAFKVLNEMSGGVASNGLKEPIFNLVPVLGAGNSSASLDNIITCELFSLRS
ncbi:hypothetical protein F2Q69_00002974 [Brassica cretica]|uniref:Diphthine--ammonia ligase n=1 Tax=Brassica cretica TaxID=69181 RepID=A0A8S9PMA4_BRACR|nr:hypothetical protein F2Q69_00002974 [Brassica cretica]